MELRKKMVLAFLLLESWLIALKPIASRVENILRYLHSEVLLQV